MAHVVCRLVLKLKSKKASGILRTVFSLIIWSERVGWGGWTLSRKKKKERKRKKANVMFTTEMGTDTPILFFFFFFSFSFFFRGDMSTFTFTFTCHRPNKEMEG